MFFFFFSSGNLFAVYINHYRRVSGLSVSFLNAILVMDCAFLVSLVFMYSPRGHLPRSVTQTCLQRGEPLNDHSSLTTTPFSNDHSPLTTTPL